MILSDAAIKNRVTVMVLVVLIIAAGAVSYLSMPREAAPDVAIPFVLVSTHYEGVSPADIESSVTMKIEKELTGLKGLKEITSTSSESNSVIAIEFLPGIRTEDALQYVRDKVDLAKGELPSDADEPVIKEITVAEFPMMIVNISGELEPWRVKEIADRLEDEIESLEGVLNVDVLGGLEREVRLEIYQDRVAAYGMSIPDLVGLIPSENVNVSAGGLETPVVRFNVRVPGEFGEPDQIRRLPLVARNGRTIYLQDVADIRYTFKDRETYARLNGVDSISLSIQKRTGANILEIAKTVEIILAEARKRVPAGVKMAVTMDMSKDVRMMVSDLENNIVSGLILVVLVLVLFMGWRTSVIVALAIPLSMLISFAVLEMLGYTLNMIVLFSLTLALGMLVDNAIVIVENIFRHRQLGCGNIEAARKGTAEVAWPVITSTATTIAAFTPLAFWPGVMGEFMGYLPVTVIVTLASSLFVAMVISPTICSMVGGGVRPREESVFVRGYRRLLRAGLKHWPVTISLSVLLLLGLGITYARRGRGVELFPSFDPRRAFINIRCPQGTNIKETNRLCLLVEDRLEPFANNFEHVIANVGSAGGGFSFVGTSAGPHVANVTMVFKDYQVRPRPSAKVVEEIREALADIPGTEIKIEKEREGPPSGAPITVRIIGEDFGKLELLADKANPLIADVPGLVNLRSDLESAVPELAFAVDRARATLLGVNSFQIGSFKKLAVFGREVGKFRQFNEEYDITVRLPLSERTDIQDLLRLRVSTMTGAAVPSSSLGKYEYRAGMGTISRINQKRVVTLTGDAEGRLASDVLADVQARLDSTGYASFLGSDVRDWPGFCKLLAETARENLPSPARRVWDALPGKARRAAAKVVASGTVSAKQKNILAAGFKDVLAEPDFYNEQDFAGVNLPEEATRYLQRNRGQLSNKEIRRLNRVLLEAALGGWITARPRLELEPGYSISYAGEQEEQQEASQFLFRRALPLALLLIVLILVTQFNTLSAPLIIMVTVILSVIGVLVGLLVCGMPFGVIMTGVGVISLAGVVVNNANVLLDCTRRLQRRGMDVVAAAVAAGVTRLRPVLLTATTTILGLIPMATGLSLEFHGIEWANLGGIFRTRSESSQFWAPMAVAVIFGLAFATLLTLVVVPTLYATLYRAAAHFGLGGLRQAPGEGAAPPDRDRGPAGIS